MNTKQSDKCPICEYERQMPKHMLERALFRALPDELKTRIRAERKESLQARRKQSRVEIEKWNIDNPLAKVSSIRADDFDTAQKEYRELKRIHTEGQCVERKNTSNS